MQAEHQPSTHPANKPTSSHTRSLRLGQGPCHVPHVPAVPRTLSHELDLVGHGGAQLIAGEATIGALEPLGKVAVVACDGEGARMGCLVHGHTQFLLGFEVDAISGPAEPVGRKGLRGLKP